MFCVGDWGFAFNSCYIGLAQSHMHTSACTGLIEWLQVFSAFFLFINTFTESLAGNGEEFSLKLLCKSGPKSGASCNAVVVEILLVCLWDIAQATALPAVFPGCLQARLLWLHVCLSV